MIALITGASSGIGYEIAQILASKKMDLVLVARNYDVLLQMAIQYESKYGIKVYICNTDLTKTNAAQVVYEFCNQQNIKIDYLINNAGVGDYSYFSDSNWDKIQGMMQLNMIALTQLCHLFIPHLNESKCGKILNIASTAAFQAGPKMAVYFASKSFVLHFSEALYFELNPNGITVTSLCPGPTKSNFTKLANMENSQMFKSRFLPSAYQVALSGIDAMEKGKMTYIHGFKNKILAFSNRLVPRKLSVFITQLMLQKTN